MSRSPFGALTRVRYRYPDLLTRQRAQNLLGLAVVDLIIAILLFIGMAFSPNLPQQTVLFIGSLSLLSALSGVLTWMLVNWGSILPASFLYVLLLFIRAIILALPNNPTMAVGPFIAIYSLPIVATSLLLNRRSTFVMIFLSALSIAMSMVFNANGWLLKTPIPDLSVIILVNIFIVVADGILLTIFTNGQLGLLRRSFQLSESAQSALKISQSISDTHNLDDLFTLAFKIIREQLGYYFSQIFLIEAKTGLIIQQTASRSKQGEARRLTLDSPGIIAAAIKAGKTQRIDVNSSANERSELLTSVQSGLLIPLKHGEQLFGLLDVQSMDPDGFDERSIEILEAIAAQLAIALENLRTAEELRATGLERRRLSDQLQRVNQEMERLGRETNTRAWARYLENRGDNTVGFDWNSGAVSASTALNPTLSRGLTNSLPEIWIDKNEKILSVPILSRGQVLGVMEFRASADKDWNNRSIELARVIAQRLALALDNIRLFEQAQVVANREQVANQVAGRLQAKTDIDSLLETAAESFQQALGASRASIRLGAPDLAKKPEKSEKPELSRDVQQ